jgi:hypothetical protein
MATDALSIYFTFNFITNKFVLTNPKKKKKDPEDFEKRESSPP